MPIKFPKRKKSPPKQKTKGKSFFEQHKLAARSLLIDVVLGSLLLVVVVGIIILSYEMITGKPISLPPSTTTISTAIKNTLQIAVDLLK